MPYRIPSEKNAIGQEIPRAFYIFDTHPIQYRSPIFVTLYKKLPGLQVFFFNESFEGKRWWFQEVGKIPSQHWGLSLQQGFPNKVISTRKHGFLKNVATLYLVLSQGRPSAVAIYGYYLPEHWILRVLCSRLNIPLLFIGETFSFSGSLFRRLMKKILYPIFFSGVDGIISIGNRTFDYYTSHKKKETILLSAKYCTEVEFFTRSRMDSAASRLRIRESLGIPESAFVSLFVGRLFERKRPQDMIEIHKRLNNPLAYTIVVGNGPMENELRFLSGNFPRIIFVGFKSQPEVREIYHAVDLLIVPSEYETWGLVVNEAFAAGRTALVTQHCGVAGDLVKPGETGYIYNVGDIETATHLVSGLLEDRMELKRLSSNAQKKVREEYHIDQFANAFVDAFSKLSS